METLLSQPFNPDQLRWMLSAALVLILPGAAWLALTPARAGVTPARAGNRGGMLVGVADAVGLSLAITALGALALFLLEEPLSPNVLVWFYRACLAGIVAGLLFRWRRWRVKPLPLLAALVSLALLAGLVYWRLDQARTLLLPAWVDSVHHTLIVSKILAAGGLPASLAPQLNIDFAYHYGFHAAAALFARLSGLPPAEAVLWFGQIINAAVALSLYRLAYALWGDWRRALLAFLLTGFALQMPAYYLTWGRYTLLTGLVLLPLALSAGVEAANPGYFPGRTGPGYFPGSVGPGSFPGSVGTDSLPGRPRSAGRFEAVLRLAILTAGVALSHFTALLLEGFFFALLLAGVIIVRIAAGIKERKKRTKPAAQPGENVIPASALSLVPHAPAEPVAQPVEAESPPETDSLAPPATIPPESPALSYIPAEPVPEMAAEIETPEPPQAVVEVEAPTLPAPLPNFWGPALGALAGVALALPWLLRAWEQYSSQAGVRIVPPSDTSQLDYLRYIGYLLGPRFNHILLIAAAVGLLLALFTRRGRLLALFGLLLSLLTLPWGLRLGPFRPDHMAILLFLPAAPLLANLLVEIIDLAGRISWRIPRTALITVLVTAITALIVYGGVKTRDVLNNETVLVDAADIEALDWIRANTPADSRWLANTQLWMTGVYRGVDGAYWLLPYAGRWSIAQPALYTYTPPDELAELTAWMRAASTLKTCDEVFWNLTDETGATYLYLHRGRGSLQPEGVVDCAELLLIYRNDEVILYEITR